MDQYHAQSQSLKNFSTILVEFSKIKPEEKILIMISVLLAGVLIMEPNIGLLETLGEAIGEKEET